LLTSPKIASAGSLFASWLQEIKNTITIEKKLWRLLWTQRPHTIKLQTTKIKIDNIFSCEFYMFPKKENQKYGRGIIPDYEITQTFDDYINNTDTQLNFTMDLISKQ
jgi:hypothetical protein